MCGDPGSYVVEDDEGFEVEPDDEGEYDKKDLLRRAELIAEKDYEEFCREHDIEPDEHEVYEHWIVTDYFARKLKEQGETVGEVCGLTIWGRCATGQAISMDGVITRIARDMEILEGQRYDWSKDDA